MLNICVFYWSGSRCVKALKKKVNNGLTLIRSDRLRNQRHGDLKITQSSLALTQFGTPVSLGKVLRCLTIHYPNLSPSRDFQSLRYFLLHPHQWFSMVTWSQPSQIHWLYITGSWLGTLYANCGALLFVGKRTKSAWEQPNQRPLLWSRICS